MTKKAFTLIEVLGAIVILAIAITPVMGLMRNILIISQKQEWQSKSLYYAQQKMEEEIERLRNNFLSSTTSGTVDGNYTFRVDHTQDDDGGSPPTPIPLNRLKIVTVTVWYDEDASGWPPAANETKVVLSTKIVRR